MRKATKYNLQRPDNINKITYLSNIGADNNEIFLKNNFIGPLATDNKTF